MVELHVSEVEMMPSDVRATDGFFSPEHGSETSALL